MSHAMSFVTMNLVTMMYLIVSVCFIQALKGLVVARRRAAANAFGMSGMAIAAVTTVALILKLKEQQTGGMGLTLVIIGIVTGGHRRLPGKNRGNDEDAGTGGGHAFADRLRRPTAVAAVSNRGPSISPSTARRCPSVTVSSCSSAPLSAPSLSPAR